MGTYSGMSVVATALSIVASGKGDGAVSIKECIGKTLLLDDANAFCVPNVYL